MPREGKQSRSKKRSRAADVKTPRTIAVVGAGRLGTALALALVNEGFHINALVAQHSAHARRAARLFNAPRPRAFAAHELAALPPADLLLIATPDDEIAATAARLAEIARESNDECASGARTHTCVALHTSGALSSAVLAPLRARGFAVGSLHPLVSVSDARAGALTLRGAHFCIEGDTRAVRVARRLVRALAGHSFTIA